MVQRGGKMKLKTLIYLAVMMSFMLSCVFITGQPTPPAVSPPAPGPTASALPATATQVKKVEPTATQKQAPTATQKAQPPKATPTENLPAVNLNPIKPDLSKFAEVALQRPQGNAPSWSGYTLPVKSSEIKNYAVTAGLTPEERDFLLKNGFVVVRTQEKQFRDIRKRVNDRYGQLYFISTDAAYHTLHINFDEYLKSLERERMRPAMLKVVQAVLLKINQELPAIKGPAQADAQLASDMMAVAAVLFDAQVTLDSAQIARIRPQLEQIKAGAGLDNSALIPNFKDDYGAYKPVGHYAGDPELEQYFQGMTWLGRVNFKFSDPEAQGFKASRAPLYLTTALRLAVLEDKTQASASWSQLNEILNFLIGASDDPGPAELAVLMDKVYGPVGLSALADEAKWQTFLGQVKDLPAAQINSAFVDSLGSLEAQRTFRFMGQRFTLDGFILQNLIFDKVGTMDKKRVLASGLDVMAAFGSAPAYRALEKKGETLYANYPEQMAKVRQAVQDQPEAQWISRFYSGWLYAFIPQVAPKIESYPPFMRGEAWGYKELNSALSSWAQLKHDTVLYSKAPEPAGGGGPPSSPAAPVYVEPNPEVFYRMAYITAAMVDGIDKRLLFANPGEYTGGGKLGLGNLQSGMKNIANAFEVYGKAAELELAGKPISQEMYDEMTGCLGAVECAVEMSEHYGEKLEMPPVPVVAVAAGAENNVLEVGVGYVDRIYVVAPLGGELHIAQGGVLSYYEFTQPRSKRLTDQEWRTKLSSDPPDAPEWVQKYALKGGKAKDVLMYRIGDYYLVTAEGNLYNVREKPGKSSKVLTQLVTNDFFKIVGGPVYVDGTGWWQMEQEFGGVKGWLMENPAWIQRAYGQSAEEK
jgi:hypothetical protein